MNKAQLGHFLICPLSAKLLFKYDSLKYGLPGGPAGNESTCNAGDPSSITELGRSPGEGIGYALQSSWASLVAQMAKNLPAMRET